MFITSRHGDHTIGAGDRSIEAVCGSTFEVPDDLGQHLVRFPRWREANEADLAPLRIATGGVTPRPARIAEPDPPGLVIPVDAEQKRRGRPPLPRDEHGNVIRD